MRKQATALDIATLYADVEIRHGLTARLKLEALRANYAFVDYDAAPVTAREPDGMSFDTVPSARNGERVEVES